MHTFEIPVTLLFNVPDQIVECTGHLGLRGAVEDMFEYGSVRESFQAVAERLTLDQAEQGFLPEWDGPEEEEAVEYAGYRVEILGG